jgi:RNA polymerase subunit RPABC4/transcription elongation factor Spt4
VISIPAGKYGAGASTGARITNDFTAYFTTEVQLIDVDVDVNWPSSIKVKSKMVVTLENPLGFDIIVAILIEEERGSNDYIEYVNVTLEAGESDRQVTLDTEDLEIGEYMAKIRIYQAGTDPLLVINEYPLNINIVEDDDEQVDSMIWVFVVIGLIVILVAILAVYLIAQSRKKDLEEELKEEFECPECHHLVSDDDTVCPHCGAEFEEEAYKCPKCGSMLDPDDEECPECGYDFEDQEKMELEDDGEDSEMELEDDEEEDEMELEDDEDLEEMEEEEED